MTAAIACPDANHFQRLATGEASAEEMEQFASHLEHCLACAERTDAIGDHSALANALRRSTEQGADDRRLEPLMARLQKLGDPYATTAASTPNPAAAEFSTDPGVNTVYADTEVEFSKLFAPAKGPGEIGWLGAYRVLKILGAGGMGVVFEAEDTVLKRRVALKAMLPEFTANAGLRQRFLREAQAAAAVHHDHVVVIHQAGEVGGVAFLAMELLEGESLEARLKRGPLPLAETLRIGREIAEGLAAAHEHGLIHRDIKPANIWLQNGRARVKILDFGLAREVEGGGGTTTGAIVGTPAYMSPEQANSAPVDFHTDLFSLGCVLYRMCTGVMPFTGRGALQILREVAEHQPKSPRELNPAVPAELSALVMRLLEKDRGKRPESARQVAFELGSIASRPAASPPPKRRSRWLPLTAAASLLACLAVVAAGIVFYWQTPTGVVRIEINDPDIKVAFDKNGPSITGVDKHDIKLTPGEFGLTVERGDLKFDTDKFILKRGETITLKIEWFKDGKLQVVRGDKVIGAKWVKADGTPVAPAVTSAPQAQPSPQYALEFERKANNWQCLVNLSPALELDFFGPRTIEGYVTPQSMAGHNAFLHAWNELLDMSVDNGTWSFGFRADDRDGKKVIAQVPGALPATLGKKTHVALVFNGRQFRLFLDGATAATKDVSDLSFTKMKGSIAIGFGFKGLVSEVRISKVARYDKDFTPAQRFEPDADTLALYHFDEGSGDRLTDSSGNGHHGKIVGAKWVKADGTAIAPAQTNQYALRFDEDARVPIESVRYELSLPHTYEAYVTPITRGPRGVIGSPGHSGIGTNGSVWSFNIAPVDPKESRFLQAQPLVLGKKAHVAGVYTDGLVRLFVNGKLVSEAKTNGLRNAKEGLFQIGGPKEKASLVVSEVRISKVARYTNDFTPAQRFEPDADTLALYHFDEGTGDVLHDSSGNGHHGRIVGAKWVKIEDAPLPSAFPPLDPAWLKEVAALPAKEQVEAVKAELMKRNPGFDGKFKFHKIDNADVVTWLDFSSDAVKDISPLRVWTGLEVFRYGNGRDRVPLADLSPLKDLKLKELRLTHTLVSDLSPLKGMTTLTTLQCSMEGTVRGELADLSPLKDLKLTTLEVANSLVSDLSPLKDLKLTNLHIGSTRVADLSPLKDMKLTELRCSGSRVTDLSPLKGMRLTRLHIAGAPIADLTPVKGMQLTSLDCIGCPITDIALLKGMPLTLLHCQNTKVSDFTPLQGMMTLKELNFGNTLVTDLAPLKGLALRSIDCAFEMERDAAILRSIKTLQFINGKPAAAFWKEVDAKTPPSTGSLPPLDPAWLKKVAALPAKEQVEAVKAELMKRNPGFDGTGTHKIRSADVTELGFQTDNVKDISPLRALTELQMLRCIGSGSGRLSDLSPLKGMKLTFLDCSRNPVQDLSPLKDMRLDHLNIGETRVSDLSPLKDMKLTSLDFVGAMRITDLAPLRNMPLRQLICKSTRVSDLSPLKGMKLETVWIHDTQVTDLSPLRGNPLKVLNCDFRADRDTEILRSIKTLETINGKAAAQFWKEVDKK